MASPANEYSFDLEVAREAGKTWRSQTAEREEKRRQVSRHKFDAAEPRERLAKRANRLIAQVQEAATGSTETLPDELRNLLERGPFAAHEIDNVLFERVVGATRDFLSVSFLGKGTEAIRSAARMVTAIGQGRVSFGTGCMVSPRLLMTNHHVLPSSDHAINTVVEFDYQLDLSGNPLKVQRFELDPSMFFLNDKALDFALVAVAERSSTGELLGGYGWSPLFKEEGKIVLGNCVNIIQHPRGEMKQIVIRENKLVDLLDNFLHYEGDTEPGSSGAPVFNDQWEIVGLHHSGVPRVDEDGNLLDIDGGIWKRGHDPQLIDWVANEGIRASRIVAHVEGATLREHEKRLRDQLLAAGEIDQPSRTPVSAVPVNHKPANPRSDERTERANSEKQPMSDTSSGVAITIPLNIQFSLGIPSIGGAQADLAAVRTSADVTVSDKKAEADRAPITALESITPDPDYENRPGYDAAFLGFEAPMPTLAAEIRGDAVEIEGAEAGQELELKYYNYSVIMNRRRRIAFVAAVNFNAGAKFHHKREPKDRWFFDPRIDEEVQAGDEHYSSNPLDRGHLVRRADSGWGSTARSAKIANDDTFHFTNCSPQHEIYNQSSKASAKDLLLWGNLEKHVAKQGKTASDKKLSVFNGPVLRRNDRLHRGLRVPKEFWKIIVYKRDSGKPGVAAFVLSQSQLIRNLPEEDFEPEEYRPFQVRVSEIESRTKLDFGKFSDWDSLTPDTHENLFESGTEAVPLENLGDVIL